MNASKSLSETNLYPQTGQLKGTMTDRSIFQNLTAYDKDFNEDTYDWTYREPIPVAALIMGGKFH